MPPYQSRLFNFLNSQAVRLKDGLQRGWRQFKIAATLGAQVLLYPLYLLVQASRITSRQLQENVKKIPQLRPTSGEAIAEDEAVIKVLEAISPHFFISSAGETLQLKPLLNPYQQNLDLPLTATVAKSPNPPLLTAAPTIQLQGIATHLENRHLVIVGQDNLILDVLPKSEQEQLEKRIYLEIANYRYQKRLASQIRPRVLPFAPVLAPTPPQVLAPIRWFWEILRWEQHSEIATTINLFGEATLAPVELKFSPLGAWWAKVQHLPASAQIITLSEAEERNFPPLARLVQTALTYFSQESVTWPEKAQSWLRPVTSSLDKPENPFAVQVLIAAAVEYFFVKKQGQLPASEPIGAPLAVGEEDPWLMWEDLYPEVIPLQPTPTEQRLEASSPAPRQRAPVNPFPLQEATTDEEWLDAEAQPLGYVQHPLEGVLQVLDQVILWLEELFVGIYAWLRAQWRRYTRR